jgi:hypothetical protein
MQALFSPNSISDMGILDNAFVVNWLRLGRTQVHVGAPAVVPLPKLLAKSFFLWTNIRSET